MAPVIRILFLAANPKDTPELQLVKEVNSIDEELLKARLRDQFELQQRHEASLTELQPLLLRYTPQIVHFSGHGHPESALVFQDEEGNSEIAPPTALTNLFGIINSDEKIIRCVVLNACYAERQAEAISKYVPCVVGMSSAISDQAAIKFATSFYRALGYGQSVNNAFLLGCNEIALKNIPEEATPRLKYAPGVDPAKVYLTKTPSKNPARSVGNQAKKCFVIAPIGAENSEIRARSDQIFSYVIKPAVEKFGYEAIRGDHISQPGMINSQVFEHLLEDELAIADLTGKNPNVYYELAIRHGNDKPVISIKEESESLAFDVVGMRTIDVDFRFIAKMDKCKEAIIKQIQTIENGTVKIDSPIKFTKQAKLIEPSILEAKMINSEIEFLKPIENNQKVKELRDMYNSKILQAIKDLPKANTASRSSSENQRNRALWVDDYPANNQAIMDVYRRLGIEFDLALDTDQAFDYLSKKNYNLIISDIGRHSQQDAGIRMIHEIKKKFADTPPVIIYSSGSAIEKYGKNALDEGACLATASARDLVLKMNEILNLE